MEFWLMLIAHMIIFFFVKRRISRKKRRLELEKSHLLVENESLKGQLNYYKRKINANAS